MKYKLEEFFVPHQENLELKKLGFDEPCFGYGDSDSIHIDSPHSIEKRMANQFNKTIKILTFSQAFNFFREKYKLHGTITSISQESWQWHIQKPGNKLGDLYEEDFPDYEEAELDCLRKLIEICKNTNQ